MTKSEDLCNKISNLYFFKELVKSDLIYITENKEEKELADIIIRVANFLLTIQIKEKIENDTDIQKWLNNKVYKKAKNQIKNTINEIKNMINFKSKKNEDILDNIDNCLLIPIIIFDIGDKKCTYKNYYESKSSNIKINIFEINDFEIMCKHLISPMEIIRYLNERIEYTKSNILIIEDENKITIGKTNSETSMLNFYIEKYNLKITQENNEKLLKFNTYLNLFEKHCITNKQQYKIFIKYLSNLLVKEIYNFIDRINLIIDKGFNNELYWDSYIISDSHNILFISITKDKYNLNFINFISNVFMYKFKLNKILTIISYSIDNNNNYELDFAICEYESENVEVYKEAIELGFADVWNSKREVIV